MNQFTKSLLFLIMILPIDGNTQDLHQKERSKRSRENFDFNWQFHKGDITIKREVKAGGQGGITDANVKNLIASDTLIDYSNAKSARIIYPRDWKEVNLPHDWAVEGSFVHDNSMGNQPAVSGYLPTGVGFYRKEFEIPETEIAIPYDKWYKEAKEDEYQPN